jgi:hypothetical protein
MQIELSRRCWGVCARMRNGIMRLLTELLFLQVVFLAHFASCFRLDFLSSGRRISHAAASAATAAAAIGACCVRACDQRCCKRQRDTGSSQCSYSGEKQFLWRPPHQAPHTACFIGADRCGCFGYSQIRNKSAYAQQEKSLASIFVH